MSYTVADVEEWLGVDTGSLDTSIMARVKDSVDQVTARYYDLTTPADETDQALIMLCGRLYRRKHSPGGFAGTDDRGAVILMLSDPDIQQLLGDRLITAGIFGPSDNYTAPE